MVLARADRVIKLAGNPTDQQSQNLMNINVLIADSDQMVYDYTRTKAEEWVEDITHGFNWARDASEKLAASRLASEFHDINQISAQYKKDAMENLKVLRQIGYGTMDGNNPSFVSAVTAYKTIPGITTNGKSLRYRSANAFGGEYD